MENKIEELTKGKNEQIEKLTKIKDLLKKKLVESKEKTNDLDEENSNLKKKINDLDEENSILKEKISELDEKSSSIDQETKPGESIGNEQILEFLKGNSNKMDFVLKKLENLISMEVKKSEYKENRKQKSFEKTALVKEEENSSDPESDIEKEIKTPKRKKEDPKPPKSIKREPSISKKLLSIPYPTDGTIRCPNCNKIKWKEIKNKSKMISRGVYAKQYYCKTCRTEWEFEY